MSQLQTKYILSTILFPMFCLTKVWAPAETDAVTILLGWQIFCCLKLRGGGGLKEFLRHRLQLLAASKKSG